MLLESKPPGRTSSRLIPLVLVALCALAGAEVKAQTPVNADLRVCLRYDDAGGAPVNDARVSRTKADGSRPVTLERDQAEEGCYVKKDAPFGAGITYVLRVDSKNPAYPATPAPFDTSKVEAGKVLRVTAALQKGGPPQVLNVSVVPPKGGSAETGGAKTVRACVEGVGGAPVTNATVILKGAPDDPQLTPEATGSNCYVKTDVTFESGKSYALFVKADNFKEKTEPLNVSNLQNVAAVSTSGPIKLETSAAADLTGGEGGWRKWLAIAGIAVGILVAAAIGYFLGRSRQRPGATDGGEDALLSAVKELTAEVRGIKEQQQKQTTHLEKLLERLGPREAEEEPRGKRQETVLRDEAPPPQETPKTDAPSSAIEPKLPAEEQANKSYASLLRGGPVTPEPIYLDDVGGSGPEVLLGGNLVVLEESDQGAIVLIRLADGESGRGWAYPNTALHFRSEALSKVFPKLGEEQFKLIKQTKSLDGANIEPVPVRKLDARHWQVESS